MLDAESQRSYITKRAKKSLKLKPEDKQQMSIMTFGGQCGKEFTCEVIRIRMKLRDDLHQELKIFVISQICKPLTAWQISVCKEKFEDLLHLDMADSSDGETAADVEMLIGADYNWAITTGHTCRRLWICCYSNQIRMDLVWAWTDCGKRSLFYKLNDSDNREITIPSCPISDLDNIFLWFLEIRIIGYQCV